MRWPSFIDYEFFVKNAFDYSVLDPRLKNGKPMNGISGGFSRVYPVRVASQTFALRCWTKNVRDAKQRYKQISDYLQQVGLPYFVDFEYVSKGIRVNETEYPIIRMEWVEGVSLREFIEQNWQTPHIFKIVADEFQKMVSTLHKHRIAHGDLQDGNILLKRNSNSVEIKLIDYDSLFVPALQGEPEQILGLPEYQHPKRIAGGGQANEKVDYFSELVIYLSFLSLTEKPELWNQFKDKAGGLLFSKKDFENPDDSDIFRELEKLSPDIQQLAATLKDFCAKTSIDQLVPLEAILPKPDANAYSKRGNSLLNSGQYNEALAEFHKAIALNPNYKKARYGIGRVYLHSKRYTDATNAFAQLIKDEPNYTEAHHGLGLAYFNLGDKAKAAGAANAALRIDPYYQPARELLEVIKSATRPSVRPRPRPKPTPPDPTPNHGTNVWQLLTALLGLGLVICIVVLTTQGNGRNAALLEIEKLKRQQSNKNSEIQRLTTNIQTLEKEKGILSSENQQLKSQIAEKDKEIQRLNWRSERPEGSDSQTIAGMTLIPAGAFRMGSNATSAYSDEKPVHTVYVNAFYIDKYEVTNEEYKKFIEVNPQWRKDRILRKYHDGDYLRHWTENSYPHGKGDHPVTWVSWYAAVAFAQWKGKRLPTEAEWEKAARGGLAYNRYLSRNLINSQTANYGKNVGRTTLVGNYFSNSYGIYDMVGNVSEWCLDEYRSYFYANSPSRNPVAGGSIYSIIRDFKNTKTNRVSRGGSWASLDRQARVAYRSSYSPHWTAAVLGFRCVKPINP